LPGADAAGKPARMADAAPEPAPRRAPPFPGPAAVLAAFRALTVVGAGAATGQVDASAVYYPLVGLVLGALWSATDALVAPRAGRATASVAVVLVAAAATRARPLLALGRTLAAVPSGRAKRLAMLDAGRGALVAAGTLLVLAAEVAVLAALDRYRLVGLVLAPTLGCCSMVVLAVGSRAARADGRRLKFAPDVTFREFGIASTATFAFVFLTTEFLGLLLVLATAAFAIAARVSWHRWIDGVNETALLATAEAVQLLVLGVLVALS
jgi:adenosylcobinamide-GDP ribazoletransferase